MHPRLPVLVLLLLLLLTPQEVLCDPVVECFDALAFDQCTVQDTTGICSERFQQNQFQNSTYAKQLFDALISQFLGSDTVNTTEPALLSILLSPSDSTYASYLDATYGSACATDAGVASILDVSVTEPIAEISRSWLLLLLRQANFCTDNEMFIIGEGCVCKEDKDCNDGTGSSHSSFIKAVALMVVVLAIWTGWGFGNNHRQASAVSAQQDLVMNAAAMIQSQTSPDATAALVRVHKPPPTPQDAPVIRRAVPPKKPEPQARPQQQAPARPKPSNGEWAS